MVLGRFSARVLLLGCVTGIASLVVCGGVLLAFAEGVQILDGMWLAFNQVTTTGFGRGPVTSLGQGLSVVIFVIAGGCWFGLLIVGIEIGNLRFQKYSLIDEVLRPLERRPRDRLFHTN